MSDEDVVTIVLDARKERAGIIRELVDLLERFPGDAEVFVNLATSQGPHVMRLTNHRVSAREPLFLAIRDFGLTAVPGRVP